MRQLPLAAVTSGKWKMAVRNFGQHKCAIGNAGNVFALEYPWSHEPLPGSSLQPASQQSIWTGCVRSGQPFTLSCFTLSLFIPLHSRLFAPKNHIHDQTWSDPIKLMPQNSSAEPSEDLSRATAMGAEEKKKRKKRRRRRMKAFSVFFKAPF